MVSSRQIQVARIVQSSIPVTEQTLDEKTQMLSGAVVGKHSTPPRHSRVQREWAMPKFRAVERVLRNNTPPTPAVRTVKAKAVTRAFAPRPIPEVTRPTPAERGLHHATRKPRPAAVAAKPKPAQATPATPATKTVDTQKGAVKIVIQILTG